MDIVAPWRVPVLVAGTALLLPFALGAGLSFPTWLTALAVLLSLAGGALVIKQILFSREQRTMRLEIAATKTPSAVEPAIAHEEHHVPAIPIDSAEPYYRFILSCTVCWTTNSAQHGNPRGLAVHSILERARHITVSGAPTDPMTVQNRLAAELGVRMSDPSGQVIVWAVSVGLSVPEEDARRLDRLVELRKEKQVLHHERELEQSTRAYLTGDVLTDPGSAVVWWLARHPEQVREAAALLPTFAQLSAAVTNTELAPHYAERLDTVDRHALSAVANGEWPRIGGQHSEGPSAQPN
ncbi:MAG: hypothetical protein M3443_04600 [Actinomycetota bacterium]|nr:hypothetical protein [Actinomycetota bacterium]